jgi:hypothetical protein
MLARLLPMWFLSILYWSFAPVPILVIQQSSLMGCHIFFNMCIFP